MRVNLGSMPSPNKVSVIDLSRLNGGLNLRDLSYRIDVNESPAIQNLWWEDGILQCRPGQVYVSDDETLGQGFACEDQPYYGYAFFHAGDGIYYLDLTADGETPVLLMSGVPENRGTFFRYDGALFYKNRGGFFRIDYDEMAATPFSCVDMTQPRDDGKGAYTPIVVINASPANGSGALYQPENRLCAAKTLWYNAENGVTVYHLPVQNVDAVLRVIVDGVQKTEGTDYTVDLTAGTVTFTTAPPVTQPATNNTVRITYSKANPDAFASVMDGHYALAAGNGTSLCILIAGCVAQPNAVFWNANDNLAMNAGYFPMTNYNLCGNAADPVTGFGLQYDDLIVFKEHSVGKLIFSVESVSGRDSILFAYQRINSKIGCDLPESIQLIENNLVFANTLRGVHVVRSASAAYENNITCISEKVNGSDVVPGLLVDLRESGGVSVDDGQNYWLCCGNGRCYVWDYRETQISNPCWYLFTEIYAAAFFMDGATRLYHLDAHGRLTRFDRCWADYGEAIAKVYTSPTFWFGSYDRLKDVTSLLMAVRGDTNTSINIRYDTDYETRYDLTPIRTGAQAWSLVPWTLAKWNISLFRFADVNRRAPRCLHVKHFAFTLEDATPGKDMAIVSAQIFYRFTGKER